EAPEEEWTAYDQNLLAKNTRTFREQVEDLGLDIFNYRQALVDYNISYIAVRDVEAIPRFAKDPLFSLVFINNEVAIFQVHKDLS
ncbi:MAG: hypothetical protein WC325_12635, partial [Candidatus Bathyarchaeia archaeon]